MGKKILSIQEIIRIIYSQMSGRIGNKQTGEALRQAHQSINTGKKEFLYDKAIGFWNGEIMKLFAFFDVYVARLDGELFSIAITLGSYKTAIGVGLSQLGNLSEPETLEELLEELQKVEQISLNNFSYNFLKSSLEGIKALSPRVKQNSIILYALFQAIEIFSEVFNEILYDKDTPELFEKQMTKIGNTVSILKEIQRHLLMVPKEDYIEGFLKALPEVTPFTCEEIKIYPPYANFMKYIESKRAFRTLLQSDIFPSPAYEKFIDEVYQ